MHLTNYSLNVHSGNFVHSESQSTGSKRTLSSVLRRLAAKGVDVKRVWSDIIALVIKTVVAVVPQLKVYYQADIPPGKPGPSCFQVSRLFASFSRPRKYKPKRNNSLTSPCLTGLLFGEENTHTFSHQNVLFMTEKKQLAKPDLKKVSFEISQH